MGLSEAYDYLTSFYTKARRNARLQRRKANTSGDSLRSSSSQDVFHSAVLSPKKVRDSGIPTDSKGESMQISAGSSEVYGGLPPMIEFPGFSEVNLAARIQPDWSEGDKSMEKAPKIPDRSPDRPKPQNRCVHSPDAPAMAHPNTTTANLAITTGGDVYNGMGISSKTSSYTAMSERSNMTVNHDPTKRAFSPFEAGRPAMPSEAESNPFSDSKTMEPWEGSRSVLVPLGSSQCFVHETENSNSSHHRHGQGEALGRGPRLSTRRSGSSASSASACLRLTDGNRERRRSLIKAQSLLKFNGSARYYGLDVIISKEVSPLPGAENNQPARQSSLLNRLRKVKSNLAVKRKDTNRHGLRRIKTMANLNTHAEYGTLEGRTVEDLARLGGESTLIFPGEYEPGVLRLPTCIAAPVNFLLQHGTSAPYGYGSACDESVVSALYSHYARQIVRAERSKDTITRTTRSIRLPSGYVYKCARTKGDAHVQDISTVLRHFLCELPGGILRSSSLYQALVQIHDKSFLEAKELRDPGRKEYIKGIATPLAAKVRMVSLALLALTTDMQLEVICAIFGLLALTADECADRKLTHQYLHPPGMVSCDFCITLPTPRTLGRVFGYFLYDAKGARELQPLVKFKLAEGTQSADVATMLIELWKHISTQLRKWQVLENA
ncbi:hypothetical protein MGYG_07653 [Nannizzia gypsea CBS 118893]|uniref:Rho-GAP domain-containing protein n=1 Tax=Arthroderma gypseum (strain ATCC MYA-4604 / CBS 118893) TaxID=535722 RepID=E4V3S4_ARTGP|nr:hypothetical protein MGYG_07653 [Nannizzia gypsea CBS 118893]EFR04648.1 hypothetical protein MGYG_07653 [Nannizzia gypsea CBS 118893]